MSDVGGRSGLKKNWYCGRAADWRTRLFLDHKVSEARRTYCFVECESAEAALDAVKILKATGYDARPDGGDEDSIFVYAYIKSNSTDP